MLKPVLIRNVVHNMKKTLIIIGILCSINAIGQELDCSDLKTGVFFAEINEPIKVKWKITRTENKQIEEIIEIPDEIKEMGYPMDPQYELIEWKNNCTYLLKYDETKSELTESQKVINDNGGALTTITSIDRNCYYYSSTITINGQEQKLEGKVCTE